MVGSSLPDPLSTNAINGHSTTDAELEKTSKKEASDLEQQPQAQATKTAKLSVYRGLGWLDRLLALWILLAIVVGILLGNYVDSVGPALQRGKFVQVSVPIGMELPPPV